MLGFPFNRGLQAVSYWTMGDLWGADVPSVIGLPKQTGAALNEVLKGETLRLLLSPGLHS